MKKKKIKKRLRGVHLESLKQELLELCLGTLSALLTFSSNLLFPDDFFPFSLSVDYCKYVFLSTVKPVNLWITMVIFL